MLRIVMIRCFGMRDVIPLCSGGAVVLEKGRTDSTDYWRVGGCVTVKCQCLGKLSAYQRVVP